MLQENLSYTDNYDSPPSYNDVCSSYTAGDQDTTACNSAAPDNNWSEVHEVTTLSFGDKKDSTSVHDRTTYTREFINSNEVKRGKTTQDNTPSAPAFENVEEDRNDVTIPICEPLENREIAEYSKTYETSRVIPSRIVQYRQMTPRQTSQFQIECQNLDRIDTSKLSNSEFLGWVDKYQRVLHDEERRQSINKFKYQMLKGLLWFAIAFILIAAIAVVGHKTNRFNRSRYQNPYREEHRTKQDDDIDKLFRDNPYLNGQRSFDDLKIRLNESLNSLKMIFPTDTSQNAD